MKCLLGLTILVLTDYALLPTRAYHNHQHHHYANHSDPSSDEEFADGAGLVPYRQYNPYSRKSYMCYKCQGILSSDSNSVDGCYYPHDPGNWETTNCYHLQEIIDDLIRPLHPAGNRGVTCGGWYTLRLRYGVPYEAVFRRGCVVLPRSRPVGKGCDPVKTTDGGETQFVHCNCQSETELCNTGWWSESGLQEPQLTPTPPPTIAPPKPSIMCYRCSGELLRYGKVDLSNCFYKASLNPNPTNADKQLGNCRNAFATELQIPAYRNYVPVCSSAWSQTNDAQGTVVKAEVKRACTLLAPNEGYRVGCHSIATTNGKTTVLCICNSGHFCNNQDYDQSNLILPDTQVTVPPPPQSVSCYRCRGKVDRNGVATDCFLGNAKAPLSQDPQNTNCRKVFASEVQTGKYGNNPTYLCANIWSQTTDSQGMVVLAEVERGCIVTNNPPTQLQEFLGCKVVLSASPEKTSVRCGCTASWCNGGGYMPSGITIPEIAPSTPGPGTITPFPDVKCHACTGTFTPLSGASDCFSSFSLGTQFLQSCKDVPAVLQAWNLNHQNLQVMCTTEFTLTSASGKPVSAGVTRGCGLLPKASFQTGCPFQEPMVRYRCYCKTQDYCNTEDWDTNILPLPEAPTTIAPVTAPPMFSCYYCKSAAGNYDTEKGQCFDPNTLKPHSRNCYDLPEFMSKLEKFSGTSGYSAMCGTQWVVQADGAPKVFRGCQVRPPKAEAGCGLEVKMDDGSTEKTCTCIDKENCNVESWRTTGLEHLLPKPSTPKPTWSCFVCASSEGNYDVKNGECFASSTNSVNCYDHADFVDQMEQSPSHKPMCATKWIVDAKGKPKVNRGCKVHRPTSQVGCGTEIVLSDGSTEKLCTCIHAENCNSESWTSTGLDNKISTLAPTTRPPLGPVSFKCYSCKGGSSETCFDPAKLTTNEQTNCPPLYINAILGKAQYCVTRLTPSHNDKQAAVHRYCGAEKGEGEIKLGCSRADDGRSTDCVCVRENCNKQGWDKIIEKDEEEVEPPTGAPRPSTAGPGPGPDPPSNPTHRPSSGPNPPGPFDPTSGPNPPTQRPSPGPSDPTAGPGPGPGPDPGPAGDKSTTRRTDSSITHPRRDPTTPDAGPNYCSDTNPYCCPPVNTHKPLKCGNPYDCHSWTCKNPAYCLPPGPNPWKCTNVATCRPPGANPFNCTSPWDCALPEPNPWNCTGPCDCREPNPPPTDCPSPFDCKPIVVVIDCLNSPADCPKPNQTGIPEMPEWIPAWQIVWWITHWTDYFPAQPTPVIPQISQNQQAVWNGQQYVVVNIGTNPADVLQMSTKLPFNLDVGEANVNVTTGTGTIRHEFGPTVLFLIAAFYVFYQ